MESQQSTNFSQRRCGGVIKGPECSDISEVPPTPACLSPCPSAPFAAPPLTPSAPSHSSEPSARVHPRGDKVTTSKSQLRSHSQAITSCWRRSSSQSTNVNTRFRAQTAFENVSDFTLMRDCMLHEKKHYTYLAQKGRINTCIYISCWEI